MPYGFYITNKGEELLGKTLQGEKLKITKACFGSGGNHNEPFNYEIEELVEQFYEKDLNPETDLISVDPLLPNQIKIVTELPVTVSGTINEIGYKDESDNLILYGLIEEEVKSSDKKQIFRYENYLDLEQEEIENIEFSITSTEYDELRQLINGLQTQINNIAGGSDLEDRVQTLEDTMKTTTSSIESLDGRVQTLEDSVGSAVERLNGAL